MSTLVHLVGELETVGRLDLGAFIQTTGVFPAPACLFDDLVVAMDPAGIQEQGDGSRLIRGYVNDDLPDLVLRMSCDSIAGLCVDALDPKSGLVPIDAELLRRTLRLNARIFQASFFYHLSPDPGLGGLVLRYALPQLWLADSTDPDLTLISPELLGSLAVNGCFAWGQWESMVART